MTARCLRPAGTIQCGRAQFPAVARAAERGKEVGLGAIGEGNHANEPPVASGAAVKTSPKRSGRSSCLVKPVAAETFCTCSAGSTPRRSHSLTVDWRFPMIRANADCEPAARTAFATGESDSCSNAIPVANDRTLVTSIGKMGGQLVTSNDTPLGVDIGQRIRKRLLEQQLSQSELARRVGVRQSTINSLIVGDSRSSKYLHLIARELGTTPAYLTGEVDDPEQDAPVAPALTHRQAELLKLFDTLNGSSQTLLTEVARSMAKGASGLAPAQAAIGKDADPKSQPVPVPAYREFTLPVLFPPEYALTRMFEALLAMVDPASPAHEQARLLAQTLPIGLSQLRDLLPEDFQSYQAEPPSAPAKPLVEPR